MRADDWYLWREHIGRHVHHQRKHTQSLAELAAFKQSRIVCVMPVCVDIGGKGWPKGKGEGIIQIWGGMKHYWLKRTEPGRVAWFRVKQDRV